MSKPPIQVEGPFPPPIVIPRWVIPAVIAAIAFIVGVLRAKGVL